MLIYVRSYKLNLIWQLKTSVFFLGPFSSYARTYWLNFKSWLMSSMLIAKSTHMWNLPNHVMRMMNKLLFLVLLLLRLFHRENSLVHIENLHQSIKNRHFKSLGAEVEASHLSSYSFLLTDKEGKQTH